MVKEAVKKWQQLRMQAEKVQTTDPAQASSNSKLAPSTRKDSDSGPHDPGGLGPGDENGDGGDRTERRGTACGCGRGAPPWRRRATGRAAGIGRQRRRASPTSSRRS